MKDLDRIAALSTLAARCEFLGEKLAACHTPMALIAELGKIQKGVEELLGSYDPGGGEVPEG